jgi:hypothetical protein
VNHSAPRPGQQAGSSARGSTGPILGSELGEQDSNPALSRNEIVFASTQRSAEICQFRAQCLAITVTGVVAHVGTPSRPDLHQAFGGEHANSGLCRVQRDPVGIPELPVRRYPATRRAGAADDLGPKNIGEPVARKTVHSLRHTATITNCLKTDTHCRRRVAAGFSILDDNCPRAVVAGPGPTSPWPARLCPHCGTVVDGGPVVFWCAHCRRGVQAADLDVEYRPPAPSGRAV